METSVEALTTLVAQELDAFRCYHVDVDNYKCSLSWWHREDHKFPTMGLLA
jgi:hypothetical protein